MGSSSMLARRASLRHPIAGDIDLPLLIPAFSSKGFGLRKTRNGREREYTPVAYELSDFARHERKAVLISAYDLHFQYFDAPDLLSDRPEDFLRNVRVVFFDSGGYELTPDFDSTEPRDYPHAIRFDEYGQAEYEAVLQRYTSLAEPLPLTITNFDYGSQGKPLNVQIEEARALFGRFPGYGTDFLMKPFTERATVVNPADLSATDFANLRGFDIIGVTEKELGRNLLTRLTAVASLRNGLDEAHNSAPIHVWGGLDPIMSCLYYFAGAQIFDGVSWLRYAYRNGISVIRECHSVLDPDLGVGTARTLNHAEASVSNLNYLNRLSVQLQQWVDYEGETFRFFHEDIRDHLKEAYDVMVSQIPALQGGT
jgi:hypothetical protein